MEILNFVCNVSVIVLATTVLLMSLFMFGTGVYALITNRIKDKLPGVVVLILFACICPIALKVIMHFVYML